MANLTSSQNRSFEHKISSQVDRTQTNLFSDVSFKLKHVLQPPQRETQFREFNEEYKQVLELLTSKKISFFLATTLVEYIYTPRSTEDDRHSRERIGDDRKACLSLGTAEVADSLLVHIQVSLWFTLDSN